MWMELVTLQFRIIPVSRHLRQAVKKISTFIKNSDLWAEIWTRDILKITLKCWLSHLRTTSELNKWIYIYKYISFGARIVQSVLWLGYKLGDAGFYGRKNFPRTCRPVPMPPYLKGIGVYFPRLKQLRYENASYNEQNQFWNPSCIDI